MKRTAITIAIAAVALGLTACGGPKEAPAPAETAAQETPPPPPPLPSAEQTRALIEASQEFSEFEFVNASWTVPMTRPQMNEPALAGAKQLVAAGWLRFDGDEVVLTEKARADRRFLARPNGFLDIVPLARKELTEVDAPVLTSDGNAEARFCFRWIPNEVGEAFRTGMLAERFASPHCGTATLQPDGSEGWEVLLLTRDQS